MNMVLKLKRLKLKIKKIEIKNSGRLTCHFSHLREPDKHGFQDRGISKLFTEEEKNSFQEELKVSAL